jgi:hypothetical protein
MVKPEVDRVLTVPTAPPAAGPDRALDPPPPDPSGPRGPPPEAAAPLAAAEVLVDATCPAVAEEEVVRLTVSPITTPMMARAEIHPIRWLRRVENHRRTPERGAGSAEVTRAGPSGEEAGGGGGAVPAPIESAAADGPDAVLDAGGMGRVSSGPVGSCWFMMVLLYSRGCLLTQLRQSASRSCAVPVGRL